MTDEEQAYVDLEYEIARNGLDYADNYRVARMNNPAEMLEYARIRKTGCCGDFDTTTMIHGVKWAIGCNYGH